MTEACPCQCHGAGPDVPCDVVGGCGSLHHASRTQERCTDRCSRMSDRGLCEWCDRRVARELAELPELWTALRRELETPLRQGGGDGRGSGEPSLGLRVNILSFLGPGGSVSAAAEAERGVEFHADDQTGCVPLLDTLASWARLAAEEFGYASRTWTFLVTRKWLVAHHDRICRQMWADDYAAELHEAWTWAKTLTGSWESAEHLRNRYCPWCGKGCLYQDASSGRMVECQTRAGGCGSWWQDLDHYDRSVKMRAHVETNGAA
jgi:hypothetical protein